MLDLYELEQFVAFAELGTLSRVAEKFHISTPSITRSMQHLEESCTNSGYDLMAIDNCDFYWEDFMGNWSAVGEYGWNATDADIERAGIDHVSVDEGDKIVYIHINDQP